MKRLVQPSSVTGEVLAPASKSFAQRAIATALLVDGDSILTNVTFCDDTDAAIGVARNLGASIQVDGRTVRIKGGFQPNGEALYCGEAGLCSRMFMSIVALHDQPLVLTGSGPLLRRPFGAIVPTLTALGVELDLIANNYPPITIKGKLQGGEATTDGSLSSQFLTGLLIALPKADQDSILKVMNLKSKPYIDMTLQILSDFGIEVEQEGYEVFKIKGNQSFQPTTYNVEGDWSGAAFLLVAGAIAGDVSVGNLNPASTQADKAVMQALTNAKVDWSLEGSTYHIKKSDIQGFEFDATECPDLFPPLVALAAYANGTSTIKGAKRLTHKESDRAATLQKEYGKMGIKITLDGDLMHIEGGQPKGASIETYHDHRIAMSASIAALRATSPMEILGSNCVAKSYPHFYEDLTLMGGVVKA